MKFALNCLAFILGGLLPIGQARFASININMGMTVSEESHKLSEDMVRICAQETDISMEELHKFRKNDFSNQSEASQCFAHCIYEQMGLMRDGVFIERDFLRTMADVTDPNYYLLAKECHEIKGSNKCDTAYKIHQCRQQHRMNELMKPKENALETTIIDDAVGNNNNGNHNVMQ